MRRLAVWVPVVLAVALFAGLTFAGRNGSGTFSLVAGNPVVTGTTISSTWANNTLSDIATELTNSLDRNGRGAMLAPLQLNSGTVGAPGLTWAADALSGFYRIGTNDYGWALAGTKVLEVDGTTSTAGLIATSSGTNQGGVQAVGSGTGYGVNGQGGSASGIGGVFGGGAPNGKGLTGLGVGTGDGVQGTGGSTSGNGGTFTGGGTGSGVSGTGGGTSGTGVAGSGGASNGIGVSGSGVGTGVGGSFTGGGTNAAGVSATGGSTNGIGVLSQGTGSGAGVSSTGGATGTGVYGQGGASGGIGGQFLGTNVSAGVNGQGGSSGGFGGVFAGGIAATGGTRQTAVRIANGDLDMSLVAYPTSTTAVSNALTPSNIPKAWGVVHTAGGNSTTCTVDEGFNVASCAANGVGNGQVVINLASAMATTNYSVSCLDESAYATGWYSFTVQSATQFTCAETIANGTAIAIGNCYGNSCKLAFQVFGRE